MRTVLLATVLLALGTAAQAQQFTFFGQLCERTELDGKVRITGASPDAFSLFRTRVGVNAQLNTTVKAVVEFQDARFFGHEKTTEVKSAPSFDLRSGYIEMDKLFDGALDVRLGRGTMAYGNERLIGVDDWALGQTFDGIVVHHVHNDFSVDLFGAAVARHPNTGLNGTYQYTRDEYLTGLWAAWKPSSTKSSLQAYYLFDTPRETAPSGTTYVSEALRNTAGLLADGRYGAFDFELDGAYQFGTLKSTTNRSIGAYMVGARAGYTLSTSGQLHAGVGLDYLSGNDPAKADTYGAFSTMYGTKHKYFGTMEYYTNVPAATFGMGLQDLLLQISAEPWVDVKVWADLHVLSTTVDPSKNTVVVPPPPGATKSLGTELDLKCEWKLSGAVKCLAGWSVFDGAKTRLFYPERPTTQWAWFIAEVNI